MGTYRCSSPLFLVDAHADAHCAGDCTVELCTKANQNHGIRLRSMGKGSYCMYKHRRRNALHRVSTRRQESMVTSVRGYALPTVHLALHTVAARKHEAEGQDISRILDAEMFQTPPSSFLSWSSSAGIEGPETSSSKRVTNNLNRCNRLSFNRSCYRNAFHLRATYLQRNSEPAQPITSCHHPYNVLSSDSSFR